MEIYRVMIDDPAAADLDGIFDYIANDLKEPIIAERICNSIEKAARSLAQNPMRHAVVPDEPYASLGVRPLPVENYTVYYIVDEQTKAVHILRVLYNRREWQNLI